MHLLSTTQRPRGSILPAEQHKGEVKVNIDGRASDSCVVLRCGSALGVTALRAHKIAHGHKLRTVAPKCCTAQSTASSGVVVVKKACASLQALAVRHIQKIRVEDTLTRNAANTHALFKCVHARLGGVGYTTVFSTCRCIHTQINHSTSI